MSNIHANGWELAPAASAANTTVWTLDLTRIRNKIRREPGLMASLAPSERARAAQYANTTLAEAYIAAHVGLRTVLIERCGTKIAGREFAVTPSGKPFLPGGPDFNISRSGSLGLVAVSDVSRVGVDIERTRVIAIDQWPVRYPVLRLFATGADDDGPGAFLQGWVRLEAWCKRRALALGPMLDGYDDEFLRNGEDLSTFDPASELLQLDVPSGYLAWCACDTYGGILQRPLDL
jgi:4'-phosphopantetheinyl transferase